jgi:thiol:disulfide interchange protein
MGREATTSAAAASSPPCSDRRRARGRGGIVGGGSLSLSRSSSSSSLLHAIAQDRESERTTEDKDKVVDISSIKQLIDNLEQAQDSLVIVAFHAKWCAACRKVQPMVAKEVVEQDNMVLLKVNYDLNKQICKSLAVKKLPYFHFYRGSQGKVAEFSASAKTFHRIKDAIALHGAPQCTLGENAVPKALEELYEDVQKKNPMKN